MNLLDLLVPEAIQLNLNASSRAEVIENLGGILQELGYVRDDFVQATLDREASMPTGLPLAGSVNAALPHVDIEYVIKPAVAMATLAKPIEFQQMVETEETVLVRLVIMLAMNQPKSQIEMLRQVSKILQSSELVDRLMECQSPEQVIAELESL